MKDNVLKKEFKTSNVQRARNLLTGKFGNKTQIQVGYNKNYLHHEEGDIWEEGDVKWTIKDGIKQNITKLDKAKSLVNTPLFCPNCNKLMKGKNNPIYYKIHKKCFDCVVEFEHQLKKEGKWEEYQNNIINDELENKLLGYKEYIKDLMLSSNYNYISEDGDLEKWVGSLDKTQVEQHLQDIEEYVNSLKK